MKKDDVSTLDRRNFMKTAALGAVTVSAAASGLIGTLKEVHAAGPPAPKSYNHKEKFSVVTIGTGNPIPDRNRASACTMIQYNGKYYLLDTGNGTNDVMAVKGFKHGDINAIMYTHLHVDHTSDFVDIMVNRWMTGGKELQIIGPPRCGGYYNFMIDFFADDLTYRKFRGIQAGVTDVGMFSGVEVTEYTGDNRFKLDGMQVTTAALTHTMYNLGYRFEAEGKSIVISGDTSFDKNLIKLAKNADVLVIDANVQAPTQKKGVEEQAFTDENITKPKPKYEFAGNFEVAPHMGLDEVAKTATEANVKTVVLTHLPPAPVNMDMVMKYFKEAGFKGTVIEGKDGLEINP
jgi:ribonuclease BN (tRNA processing enzyme)